MNVQLGKPDSIRYGFHMSGDRDLLHLEMRDDGTYSLIRKINLGVDIPTLGEWTTGDLDKVLGMCIHPGDFKGIDHSLPKVIYIYEDAIPVAVRTWSIDGTLHKVYSPLNIPQPLLTMGDLLISPVKLADGGSRSIYTYADGPLTVGCLYHHSESLGQYLHELTVYQCIAMVEDSNYLLLTISGKGLEAALVP